MTGVPTNSYSDDTTTMDRHTIKRDDSNGSAYSDFDYNYDHDYGGSFEHDEEDDDEDGGSSFDIANLKNPLDAIMEEPDDDFFVMDYALAAVATPLSLINNHPAMCQDKSYASGEDNNKGQQHHNDRDNQSCSSRESNRLCRVSNPGYDTTTRDRRVKRGNDKLFNTKSKPQQEGREKQNIQMPLMLPKGESTELNKNAFSSCTSPYHCSYAACISDDDDDDDDDDNDSINGGVQRQASFTEATRTGPKKESRNRKNSSGGPSRNKRDPEGEKSCCKPVLDDLEECGPDDEQEYDKRGEGIHISQQHQGSTPIRRSNARLSLQQAKGRRSSAERPSKSRKKPDQQLLCVHVCSDANCDVTKCRPPDFKSSLCFETEREKMLKNPSFFYVPVALVVRRDEEMRQAAKDFNIPKNRWNGSLLFQKWETIQLEQQPCKQQEGQKQRQRRKADDDEPIVITLHPVQSLAEKRVVSSKLKWYHPWITACIRSYYNTGTLRVPSHCHGLEVLLALEFFGILYTSPDQLVFDSQPVYGKIKHWSLYFTHRALLAQWVVDELRRQNQQMASHSTLFHQPFVFCTHPDPLKPGWSFCIEPRQTPVAILEGGLDVAGELPTATRERKSRNDKVVGSLTSAKVVHEFFVPSAKDIQMEAEEPFYSSPDIVPAMMREDFTSYLQQVLPELDITFTLQYVQLVSTQNKGLQRMMRKEKALQRAVLVVSWNATSSHHEEAVGTKQNNLSPEEPSKHQLKPDNRKEQNSPLRSSSVSIVSDSESTASSFTAAPTDEMAFGKLLNDTHKAVARLMNQSTQEKVDGRGSRDEFYFHGQPTLSAASGSPSFCNKSSPSQSSLNNSQNTGGSGSELDKVKKGLSQRSNGIRQSSKRTVSGGKTGALRHTGSGNQPDVEHIYQDLNLEFMFPKSAMPEEGTNQLATARSRSQESPLWTPSLLRDDTSEGMIHFVQSRADAPVTFVNASPQDQVSVTSSITRQPESVLTGDCNQRLKDSTNLSDESKESNPESRNASFVQNRANASFDGATYDDDENNNVKKLQNALFVNNPFDLRKQESGHIAPTKISREDEKQKRVKERLKAALEDLGFGVKGDPVVLGEIGATASSRQSAPDSCQFLNEMFEMFLPANVPPAEPQKSKKQSRPINSRSSSSTLTSLTVAENSSTNSSSHSQISKLPRRQKSYSHIPVAAAMGCSKENVETAAILLQLLAGNEAPPTKPTSKSGRSSFPKKGTTKNTDEDDHGESGIEVYHIPLSASAMPSKLPTRTSRPPAVQTSRNPSQQFRPGVLNRRIFEPESQKPLSKPPMVPHTNRMGHQRKAKSLPQDVGTVKPGKKKGVIRRLFSKQK